MPKLIGICGPSGSGKTTLAELLAKELGAEIISLDNYFLLDPPLKKYSKDGENWELPENTDWSALLTLINSIKNNKEPKKRVIDWKTNTFTYHPIKSVDCVILEGFLLFHNTELMKYLDLAVYIDVSDEVGLTRRLKREGTNENEMWFREVTFPEYTNRRQLFLSRADLVLDGEQPLDKNFEQLKIAVKKL